MNTFRFDRFDRPFEAELEVPGSKSLTNRALAIAALADGETRLGRALVSDDTRHMIDALNQVGIPTAFEAKSGDLVVQGGIAQAIKIDEPLYLGNAGTAMRFLTAILCLAGHEYHLTGSPRMHERPISELVAALDVLGAEIRYLGRNGCPPLSVKGAGLSGGRVHFSGKVSSQFISALLIVAPFAASDIEVIIDETPVSRPYIAMTLRLMEDFGVRTDADPGLHRIRIPHGQRYSARRLDIEGDASSASYFFAAAAITGGRARVNGLSRHSLQGDLRFVELLADMGCILEYGPNWTEIRSEGKLTGIHPNMRDISDTALTLAVTALFAEGPTEIRGIENIRFKETDRISALCHELAKLGANVIEHPDGITIQPTGTYQAAEIDTYNDHRVAMSFAVAGLRIPDLAILDPDCTSKTFPDFFAQWRLLTGLKG